MKSKGIKWGAVFSYVLILVNTLYGLFFTPYLIATIGRGQYGVYKIVYSLCASITVLDMGIGGTVLRYISKYNAEKDRKGMSNFAAMSMVLTSLLTALILAVCTVFYFCIDGIYGAKLTAEELVKAKELFLLFMGLTALHMFEKVFYSIISGCEHFMVSNGVRLLRMIINVLLYFVLLRVVPDATILLVIDLFTIVATLIFQYCYIRFRIGLKIHLYRWDMTLFKQTSVYTVLAFVQSIAVQLNGNIDNLVIGAEIGSNMVAIYSIGVQMFSMYEHFATAFSDLMLPHVSKQIAAGASKKELEDTVIRVGRLQFMLLGGALCGYLIIGKEFITKLWMKSPDYDLAWTVGAILMVIVTFPLVQNVCLSILRAENKIGFRAAAVSAMAVFNLILTVVGVRFFGPMAACIGTALGLVGANIIAMNIYYIKVIRLNIFRIFGNVFSRTWLCCLLASAALFAADRFIGGSWTMWLCKVGIFCAVYFVLLLLFGFRESEKRLLFGKFARKRSKTTA